MGDKTYLVVAEFVDKSTGFRTPAGTEDFAPATAKQEKALIDAGCIEIDTDAKKVPAPKADKKAGDKTPVVVADDLDQQNDEQLAGIATAETIDLTGVEGREAVLAAIRAARAAKAA